MRRAPLTITRREVEAGAANLSLPVEIREAYQAEPARPGKMSLRRIAAAWMKPAGAGRAHLQVKIPNE